MYENDSQMKREGGEFNKDGVVVAHEQEKSYFKENAVFFLVLLAVIIPIRAFVLQPFVVKGSSMEPTFLGNDYLIVEELSYRLHDAKRGEVVIFKFTGEQSQVSNSSEAAQIAAEEEDTFFIKRIIGLPGETVVINQGKVTIKNNENPDGFTLDEPYIQFPRQTNEVTKLGDDEYFVMGDNRDRSYDSRSWGPLKKEFLVGRAFLRLYPLSNIDLLPGNYDEER